MTFLGLDAEQWWLVGPTVALVLVTIVYVIVTGRLAGHARSSAESADQSAKAARRALQLSAMPIYHGRRAVPWTPTMIRVWVTPLTDAPAFRAQAVVSQDGASWESGLEKFLTFPGDEEQLVIDIDVATQPNFDQPYNVVMTYYDAIGTAYRTHRIGYLEGVSDFMLEEWDNAESAWVQLV